MKTSKFVVLSVVVLALIAVAHHQHSLGTQLVPVAYAQTSPTITPTPTPTPTPTATPTPTPTPTPNLQGCTPGFWKNHTDDWVGFSPNQTVGSVFTNAPAPQNAASLLQALAFPGGPGVNGAVQILLRAAVSALLNSQTVNYPFTTAEVISLTNNALASNDRDTMLLLASELDALNNLGCPLS